MKMKITNTKIASLIATLGGLCLLCCAIPVMGILGLGALEVFFCESPIAKAMGYGFMAIGLGFLGYKYVVGFCSKSVVGKSCAIGCGCSNKGVGNE